MFNNILIFLYLYTDRTTLVVLIEFLAENIYGFFNKERFKFRIFNANLLFKGEGAKTSFWAKVDIKVSLR